MDKHKNKKKQKRKTKKKKKKNTMMKQNLGSATNRMSEQKSTSRWARP